MIQQQVIDYIQKNQDLIEENSASSWRKFYSEAKPSQIFVSDLTSVLLEIGFDPVTKMREVPNHCFSGVSAMVSYKIPNNVVYIGYKAFYNCRNLQTIDIPESVTTIEGSAFGLCSLTNVVIPDSVTSLGPNAFDCCCDLVEISIPKNITLGQYVFSQCDNLRSLRFRGTMLEFRKCRQSWSSGWGNFSSIEKVICTNGEMTISGH